MSKDDDSVESPDAGVPVAGHWVSGAEKKPSISLLNRNKKSDTSLLIGNVLLATEVDQTSDLPAMVGGENAFSSSLPALLREKRK